MRKLHRPMPGPHCLSNYNHNSQKWTSRRPSTACRDAIWDKLQTMQNGFCVYCESVAIKGNGHIEHFFHKGQKSDGSTPYKHLTFNWINLFGCCGLRTGNSCGHYKDRKGDDGPGNYNASDLIRPDIDDPKDYFNFLDTGIIEPKLGLSPDMHKKATETLRVLKLDFFNGARKTQIDVFKKELNELERISGQLDDQTLQQAMDDIKVQVKLQEYQTAVLEALF
ncbi:MULTISPECIES: retron Ec78 anti-phage system effector HNH endonuclease PtuB [Aliivibrio]|uniref:TIGR02646 family protein n=2 Tax=Aliivibrio TaxID=511678 RepID=A0A4Q5KVI1_9GAMM|nr:retron Ec78 anti-phage system effector HNH endonuclease PtuB [Aliivibrio sifiae]RYU52506.1 TIGR02646 family protein [Aliivibrio finisterrensis]PQJ89121.1 TIGR02646 family protein [Aliivibrio sifiae]RYU55098.1 TIGR02646 family protein [Aliivibrio finisterrensis]RYU59757.1 TIGR02646 family protein [Aliivibrio finisterrensis]RYU65622.1 TIGR02646 family protein [Aliivibrio finisterrensis]